MSYAAANAWTTVGQGAGNLGRAILEMSVRREDRKRQREMDARAAELHDVNLGLTRARAAESGYFFGAPPAEVERSPAPSPLSFSPPAATAFDPPDPDNPNGFAQIRAGAAAPPPAASVGRSILNLALANPAPAPDRYTQVAPNVYRDNTQTREARQRAELDRLHGEAKERFRALGYDDARADALAWGQINKVSFQYSPLTREDQFRDLRETGEINDTYDARRQGRAYGYQLGQIRASGAESRRNAEFANNLPPSAAEQQERRTQQAAGKAAEMFLAGASPQSVTQYIAHTYGDVPEGVRAGIVAQAAANRASAAGGIRRERRSVCPRPPPHRCNPDHSGTGRGSARRNAETSRRPG